MSRYYDPITHRFVNSDGYFQSGGNILDTNMNAYCRNNPVMYSDPSGKTVSTIGISLLACFGFTAPYSIYFAMDDYGNCGIFTSYCDYNETGGVGLFNISFCLTNSTIWDADTIDDLSDNYQNSGFSVGEGLCVGMDLITLPEYDLPSGASVSVGVGTGIDWLHMYTSTTTEKWTSYADSSNNSRGGGSRTISKSSTPATTVKSCRGCGRPAYMCDSPTYY